MDLDPVHWLGHASFMIDDARGRIYVDPWKLGPEPPPADLILISHAHDDHFSPADIHRIRTTSTLICCTADVAKALNGALTIVRPGQSIRVGPWPLETIAAYNLGKKFHPQASGWVGYVITLSDGRRLLHTGDTDALPHHDTLKVDIACMPCGGTYTMNADEAGALGQRMRPTALVPMHWGDIVGERKDAERVRELYPATVILTQER